MLNSNYPFNQHGFLGVGTVRASVATSRSHEGAVPSPGLLWYTLAAYAVSTVKATFFLAFFAFFKPLCYKNTYFQHLIAVPGCSNSKSLNRLHPGQVAGR
jgi:hypothetical protein